MTALGVPGGLSYPGINGTDPGITRTSANHGQTNGFILRGRPAALMKEIVFSGTPDGNHRSGMARSRAALRYVAINGSLVNPSLQDGDVSCRHMSCGLKRLHHSREDGRPAAGVPIAARTAGIRRIGAELDEFPVLTGQPCAHSTAWVNGLISGTRFRPRHAELAVIRIGRGVPAGISPVAVSEL